MDDNYFDKALEFQSLFKGLKKSCKNVRWKTSTIIYEHNGILNSRKLQHDLMNDEYELQPYAYFLIREPKLRTISATKLRDRQFQRALCNAGLYQDITEHFIYDNCACQLNKGTDFALDRLKYHMKIIITDMVMKVGS